MENKLDVRKYYTYTDEILIESGKKTDTPIKRSAALAVFKNPYASAYQDDLKELYEYGEVLGEALSVRAVAALGIEGEDVESYGKTVIVGQQGEIEHGHAIIHPKIGAPFRKALGGADSARAIIPSTAKIGGIGTTVDIPVHYKDSEWVVSHVDTITITIPDAPMPDEIVVGLAITSGGRALSRLPGLSKEDVKQKV
jgi:hypothetical protein